MSSARTGTSRDNASLSARPPKPPGAGTQTGMTPAGHLGAGGHVDALVGSSTVMTDGWTAPGFAGVRDAFEKNIANGLEIGAAFAAYRHGEKVVDLWGGITDPATGQPWVENTLELVFSTTKGAAAICANRLAQEGRLDVDAPVVDYWPEF